MVSSLIAGSTAQKLYGIYATQRYFETLNQLQHGDRAVRRASDRPVRVQVEYMLVTVTLTIANSSILIAQ